MVEHSLVINLAGYLTKGIKRASQIAGEQFGGALVCELGLRFEQTFSGTTQGVGVAAVDGDDIFPLVEVKRFDVADNGGGERLEAFAREGRKG